MHDLYASIISLLNTANLTKCLDLSLPAELGCGDFVWRLTIELLVKVSDLVSLLLTINFQLLVNVAIVLLEVSCHISILFLFPFFDGFLPINPLQEVAIFVHIKGKIIIGESLDFLHWLEVFLHFDRELTFEFRLVNVSHITRILCFIQRNILEIIFILEVLV